MRPCAATSLPPAWSRPNYRIPCPHAHTRARSNEVAFSLVQIYSSTKSENLKATAASTLARLLRHNPSLVVYVVDKFGTRLFVAGLSDPNSKVRRGHCARMGKVMCTAAMCNRE